MNIEKVSNCCGCTCCANICPKEAISMVEDEKGFNYPHIDKNKCINCGLCFKSCPMMNASEIKNELPLVYGCKIKDESIRMKSTSGGIFTVISDYVLDNNGVVYGAVFDDDLKVVHARLETKEERNKACGAKYVQSDLGVIFSLIKNDLHSNKLVMFTGNPCQNAGLKNFLKNDKSINNLILVDIVCHGVPSPLIFRQYIESFDKIVDYNFRDKSITWRGANVTIKFADNTTVTNSRKARIMTDLYFRGYISRNSCGYCPFTDINRVSDMTIGDFWGIENCNPSFDDGKGVSLLLLNTNKGKEIFEKVKERLNYFESDTVSCLQAQLQYPTSPNKNKEKFWKDYNKHGYDYTEKIYKLWQC